MNIKVIAIGASTGGTEAILDILKKLPDGLPPIVITQHMPAGFTAMYAQRLDRACAMKVKEAKDGDHLERGLALVAPGGMQLKLTGNSPGLSVRVWPGKRLHGVAPAVDKLFHSAAKLAGSSAVGIILTGMGQDGASGLLEMRRRGAYTIGQDKASCIVYGMPMAAYEMGAVCIQAPLSGIPAILMNYLTRSS